MSAPRTDVETQSRWHWASPVGIAVAVIIFGLVVTAIGFSRSGGNGPETVKTTIDGRTVTATPVE